MTSQPQSDRQDDGLLPCPFCGGKAAKIESNGIGDFFIICQSDDDAVLYCGARTSDVRCETRRHAIERWNTRATRGAAEGAREDYNSDVILATGKRLLNARTAPPKPATDAMRNAGVRLWNAARAVALYRPLAKQACHVPSALMHELIDALVFSSAPVPPADGARVTVATMERAAQICRDKYCEIMPGKRTWDDLTKQEREVDIVCLVAAFRCLWASPAVAAEPWTPFRFVQVAFAQFKEPDLRKIVEAISKQFAIPVQPGAGEREMPSDLSDGLPHLNRNE